MMVEEPTVDEAIDILFGIRSRYEEHHRVEDHRRGDPCRRGPLGALRRRPRHFRQGDRPHGRGRLARAPAQLVGAALHQGGAARARGGDARRRTRRSPRQDSRSPRACATEEAKAARSASSELRNAWHEEVAKETPVVTDEDIAQVVSMWTGIPVVRISQRGDGAAAAHGGRAAQAGHRPAGGDRRPSPRRCAARAPG